MFVFLPSWSEELCGLNLWRPATKLNGFQSQAHHDLAMFFWINTWRLWTHLPKTTDSSTFHTKSHPIHSSAIHEQKTLHAWITLPRTILAAIFGVNGRHFSTFGQTPPQLNSFGKWHLSGQIITTSAEVTLNGGLIRELPQNPLNSGLGIILICPDLSPTFFFWNMEMTPKWNPSVPLKWLFGLLHPWLQLIIQSSLIAQAWSQKQAEATRGKICVFPFFQINT